MGSINWIYDSKDFTEDLIGDNYGFVYQITNLTNNRKYIGKKFFILPKPNKSKVKKRNIRYRVIGKLTMEVVTV